MNISKTGMVVSKVGELEFNEKSWTVEVKATLSLKDDLSQNSTEDTSVRGIASRRRRGLNFKLLSSESVIFFKPREGCGKPLMI